MSALQECVLPPGATLRPEISESQGGAVIRGVHSKTACCAVESRKTATGVCAVTLARNVFDSR